MSGTQPSSRHLVGSPYQAGKDLEKQEGFGKVLEKREGFVGTTVGTIPCANTLYDLRLETQEGFFADSRNNEKQADKSLSWTRYWYERTRPDLEKRERLSLSWNKYWYKQTRILVLVICEYQTANTCIM